MARSYREYGRSFCTWLTNDEHRRRARRLRDDVNRAFTEHPHDAGETYWQHLWFTASISGRFLLTTVVVMVHGIFPFLLTKTASEQIEATYRTMKTRIPKSRREAIDAADDYCV